MTEAERTAEAHKFLDTYNSNLKTIACLRMRLENVAVKISAVLQNPDDDQAVAFLTDAGDPGLDALKLATLTKDQERLRKSLTRQGYGGLVIYTRYPNGFLIQDSRETLVTIVSRRKCPE